MVNKQYSATDLEAFMKIAANWQHSNHNILEGLDIKGDMAQYMNSPTMNMYKKRERTQNWNHQEKKFLLDLCRKDMRIIENKRLDAGLTAVKNKAWKIIHFKFSKQFGTDRTCNRLKEQWRRMKACTRNEILDYNNRVARFGQEVADRKKPSPFTFEVWEFMQEAKRACKSEALDGIDYSKIPLALEEDYDYKDEEKIKFENDDHDLDDSRTPPQDMCDVDIKEETNETFNDTYANESMLNGVNGDHMSSSSPSHLQNGVHDLSERNGMHSPSNASLLDQSNGHFMPHSNDLGGFTPGFNMSNISATLEAFNALRSGQFPAAAAAAVALQNNFVAAAAAHQQQQQATSEHSTTSSHHGKEDQEPPMKRARPNSPNDLNESDNNQQNLNASNLTDEQQTSDDTHPASHQSAAASSAATTSPELKNFMDMQKKEHQMRMRILEIQLQAAKYNRDLTEINKTLALQKLQEYASRRLTS